MRRLPSRTHAILDYASGAALLAAPSILGMRTDRASLLLRTAGATTLASSLVTDYELGARRVVPLERHLMLDAATGAVLALSPWLLRTRGRGARDWLPHLIVGLGEMAGAAVTERRPGDHGEPTARPATSAAGAATSGPPDQPVRAAAPLETRGPSVTAPETPESDTERAERADGLKPDPELVAEPTADPTDALVAEEAAAAAAEARSIGGPAHREAVDDPAMGPVYEAGGGVAEGFEAAEEDLIANASHDDGHGDPMRDALSPEAESDLSGAAYAEGDEFSTTEVVDDPEGDERDPGTTARGD